MLLAPARISSIGALNQRSTAVSTTRLPTISTSTAGITVMPSSASTSLARKRPNGRPRRLSIIDLMTLRASTKASATSIVTLVTESAISTTSVRKSGDSVEVRSASQTIPPSIASSSTMPARISGGLSRNGRRGGLAGAGSSGPVGGLAAGRDTELSFAVAMLFGTSVTPCGPSASGFPGRSHPRHGSHDTPTRTARRRPGRAS